jgi:L-alanine-DL-glutamate epimerase-like enolase superfamily enzyme
VRIIDIETIVCDVDGAMIVVVVHTDEGVYGIGEVGLRSRQHAVLGALDHIRSLVIGLDPFRTEHIWQTVGRSGFYPIDRVLASALSAVDIGLWDIKGKALGVPIATLLGGAVRDRVQNYCHIVGVDDAALIDDARRALDAGWSIGRFSTPSAGDVLDPRVAMRRSVGTAQALRAALGDRFDLIIDVHTRLDLPEATTLCRELEALEMYFVEDPLRWENTDVYRELRNRTTVPLAAGEQAASKWELRRLIENDMIDYARFDPCIVGGITESKKIAGWCEAHNVRVATHNPLGPIATAAAFQLNLTLPAFGVQEQYQLPGTVGTDIFPVQMGMAGEWMQATDAPGLGIEIDLPAARARAAQHRPVPRLYRPDGAFTNW